MPTKDKDKAKEQAKERMRRYRGKGVTSEGVTGQGVTLLHRPNGADYNPDELLPDGRKRYLGPFHDGQVLDRTTTLNDSGSYTNSGDHPFRGMNSRNFTPNKGTLPRIQGLKQGVK